MTEETTEADASTETELDTVQTETEVPEPKAERKKFVPLEKLKATREEAKEWREKAQQLESRVEALAAAQERGRERAIRNEIVATAIAHGLIDKDLVRLIDLGQCEVNDDGDLTNADAIVKQFKKTKPWAFQAISTSSAAPAPKEVAKVVKSATEMSPEEYRRARDGLHFLR